MDIFTATKVNFLGRRHILMMISAALMVISLVSIATRGLNFGLDFTGGTLIEVGYDQAVDLSVVRSALVSGGMADAVVQYFGTAQEVLVRIPPHEQESGAELSTRVLTMLTAAAEGKVEMRRVEFVGPQVGDELMEQGGLALLAALAGILIYVGLRFEWRLAAGSVAALVHDTVITVGIFSLLQLDFDLTVLAAILAVIGYSLNDTIVVFDRIRENFRKMRKGDTMEVMNVSINQTLSRTIMTSFTTLLVLIALFVFGGELIHGFATALIIGIVVGTYSSIYVAAALALSLGVSREDLLPVEKEGADLDDQP